LFIQSKESEMSVEVLGKKFEKAQASCSCCGARPDEEWYTFRASLCDTDGCYFSYLCGEMNGLGGCLEAIVAQQDELDGDAAIRAEKAAVLKEEVLGDDEDGLWSEMDDCF